MPPERLAAIVDGPTPERVDDGEEIVDVGFDVESGLEIVRILGLTEPSKIRTNDFVEPAEIRHPAIPEPPRAAVTVLQDQMWRVPPGSV
jgi:hypothetical protein